MVSLISSLAPQKGNDPLPFFSSKSICIKSATFSTPQNFAHQASVEETLSIRVNADRPHCTEGDSHQRREDVLVICPE
jgi:hypothetical protein